MFELARFDCAVFECLLIVLLQKNQNQIFLFFSFFLTLIPIPSNIITNDDESDYLTFSGFESVCHPKLNCGEDELLLGGTKDVYEIQKVSQMSDEGM